MKSEKKWDCERVIRYFLYGLRIFFKNYICSHYILLRLHFLVFKSYSGVFSVNEPCILHCYAETYSYVFNIKHTAVDGMKCMDKNNLCINGVCKVRMKHNHLKSLFHHIKIKIMLINRMTTEVISITEKLKIDI